MPQEISLLSSQIIPVQIIMQRQPMTGYNTYIHDTMMGMKTHITRYGVDGKAKGERANEQKTYIAMVMHQVRAAFIRSEKNEKPKDKGY